MGSGEHLHAASVQHHAHPRGTASHQHIGLVAGAVEQIAESHAPVLGGGAIPQRYWLSGVSRTGP